jgi:aminoglycoside 3-N-acetyltransferase I
MIIRKLERNDLASFKSLINIFNEVFENERSLPADDHLLALLENRDFIVFTVNVEDEVVGGLTIYVLNSYYSTRPAAYIYDVGISPSFQGQGLGKALITEVCSYCRSHDFQEAFVQADLDDTEALSFYRKSNSSSELKAVQFSYSFQTT